MGHQMELLPYLSGKLIGMLWLKRLGYWMGDLKG